MGWQSQYFPDPLRDSRADFDKWEGLMHQPKELTARGTLYLYRLVKGIVLIIYCSLDRHTPKVRRNLLADKNEGTTRGRYTEFR
jgi:hypothetical protein